MILSTYNINGVNGRIEILLKWLKERSPDVVCLQEIKCQEKDFPAKKLMDAGYHSVWQGQKSWNGVAILFKREIKETKRGLPGDPADDHSRYIEAFISGLVIGCIYLPNGNPAPGPKFEYKLKWLKRLTAHSKKLLSFGIPTILIGDYNVIPTDLDLYNPNRFRDNALFFPESKKAYQKLLSLGWTDAIRALYPDEIIYTFYDYLRNAFGRNAGLRLGHFLLSPGLSEKLIDGGVDKHVRSWQGTSDHCPVWIEIQLTK
ncbi:exodeoxyribonuclease III [Pedobacter sp. MR22-3]|uniref:exodeoxyribonuclease III n=1 Tax=Pedobacter sp. MR22-3 TaxID=2994552 RepID=UPI0022485374|nr:exodeoxyribonuclease III [Pedobacter sp. MR22-3]MCX2584810.1 exodeoxyribonuclease III [Pedobacter sp. MR22-3]